MIQSSNRNKRCKTWRCPNLHKNKWGYCDACTEKYKAKHPELIYGTNPNAAESYRKYDQKRGSASKRGYDWDWIKFSRDFLKRHPTCAICGAPSKVTDHKDITADMMMDAWGKFDYDESHYQALCVRCNNRKGMTEDKRARLEYQEMKLRLYEAEQKEKKDEDNRVE